MLPFLLPALFLLNNGVRAALPQVDFDRMGTVGLAGAFAGLDLFHNSSSPAALSFDPSTSTLLSRAPDGSLTRVASTNSGGRIVAGCALGDVFYFAGSFSSIGSTSASNVASYTPASGVLAALGSGGPAGAVDAVFCDAQNSKLWVGGQFTTPGAAVAVWDTKASSWSAPPFVGLTGAAARVLSITANASQASLFFAGSFITQFTGNASIVLNGTNNPNVPFSAGATPFSSTLVPVPLGRAEVDGSPSTTDTQFSDINNILCPAGADGPGNTWFAADGNTAVITVRAFTSLMASGVRLGNTFQSQHGTTGFSVTSIPDNTVQSLTFVDPTTGSSQTCTDPCPLLTDSGIPYQDFLFPHPLNLTGIQIKLSGWTGAAPGLHLLQLLSSGAFASAVDSQNGQSCFAPNPSNTTRTGAWSEKVANTNIAGTTETVLVSEVDVGTPSAAGPSFTWVPFVSGPGEYDINMLVPGCTNFQDCALRTSVKVTVFPGAGLNPTVANVSQQNTQDATVLVYSGPLPASSANFVTTISMALDDTPAGKGQGGKFELVADRVQLILKAVNGTAGNSTGGARGNSGSQGSQDGFGFFEWPLSASTVDGTKILPNNTLTALDAVGLQLFTALGGNASLTVSSPSAIAALAHHSSGTIFLGGNFTLNSGSASGAANIVAFKNGALAALANSGVNGPVTSLVLDGDKLFVGGAFTDTTSGSGQGALRGIAVYDVQQNQWGALQAGVNGEVTSLGLSAGQVQVVGNFTTLLASVGGSSGVSASGLATWNVTTARWVNSGGLLVGSMTLVTNGTSNAQFVAGNVAASQKVGASGMVLLKNGGSGGPSITPLGVQLDGAISTRSTTTAKLRRSHHHSGPATWVSHISLSKLFSRQTGSRLATLPAPPPALAPAVLAGAFWTNTTLSKEVAIIGGNFSFASSSGPDDSQAVAIYNPSTGTISALQGAQINGTVRTLLVSGDRLYVGGQFTIPGTNANGLAIYDLAHQQWVESVPPLQPASGGVVVVRSITSSSSKPSTIIIAGTFAQAGALICQSICSYDILAGQWNALGSGIQGEVAAVSYAGSNQELLIASGSIALSDNTAANVAQYALANASWTAIGAGADFPGPVTAVEVNGGNSSSIFAAGQSTDGSSSFLSFWNGASWTVLGSTLQSNTTVSQLTMVPLQDTHAANGVIEPDRMLMVSGSLADSSFGNASTALFDGQTFIPYIVSSSSTGSPGAVSSLFHSFSTFSFTRHHFLATGIVILISIAIAAGIVFLLALTGIVWTLFTRRDDTMSKFDPADAEEDDDSTHHRPSSLLEHINAATRTTILGGVGGAFGEYSADREEKRGGTSPGPDHDPFGPDASNYVRAETPSDAVGGMLAEETSRPAHARYSFDGAGEGELAISAGAEVEVLDDRDPAWWYARDVRTGQEGVVPASYLY